jgi:hypothetical protein
MDAKAQEPRKELFEAVHTLVCLDEGFECTNVRLLQAVTAPSISGCASTLYADIHLIW